jgi:hypothetical protein
MVMMVADMDADIADMQADADGIGRSRRRAEQAEGKYGSDQFFHGNPLEVRGIWRQPPKTTSQKANCSIWRHLCGWQKKRPGGEARPSNPRLRAGSVPAADAVMMVPIAVAMMVVMTVKAHAHADIADMNADGDTGGGRGRAEQTQRKYRDEQFLHDNSL